MSIEPRIETVDDASARAGDWRAVRDALRYPLVDDSAPPPGLRAMFAHQGGAPVARLAIGIAEDMSVAHPPAGFVGWYEATDAGAGAELLRSARKALYGAGARCVIGPMNGSTWGRYRLALRAAAEDPQGTPPFLSEPWNPPDYPDHFRSAGFQPTISYESRLVLASPVGGSDFAAVRLLERGIRVRGLDPGAFDAELRGIFELSLAAFAANPFYTPISFAEFRMRYEAIRPLLDPELVRLAHDDHDRLVAFVFAFSDPCAPPGFPRIILKTLATDPAARGLGLGGFLTDEVGRVAGERGAAVIHALMQSSNISKRISSHHDSALFRRYALFAS
ncbi:MAG TPA: hypothetical protein VFI91_07660 [Longimicrobiaceae bacterium]|nr:hypothetical protein [Longimicrobiaceae bacterium]